MKKWFDKMDKGKKRIMGAGVAVAIVLLLTLGAWGVYVVTSKPDTVAKNETTDAKGTRRKESEAGKDDKKASAKKDEDASTEIRDEKDEDEKDGVKDVTGSNAKEKEPMEVVENANAVPQGTGTAASSAPSNPTKNTTPQGNENSNQTAAQGNTTQKQDVQQPSQQQNQSQGHQNNQQQNPPASTPPVQSTTPAPTEQPKQEEKPVEQPKQEEKEPIWHEPEYEWVVDKAAWDETVSIPIYETREVVYCSTCNANITGFAGEHLDETRHGGYWSTGEEVKLEPRLRPSITMKRVVGSW